MTVPAPAQARRADGQPRSVHFSFASFSAMGMTLALALLLAGMLWLPLLRINSHAEVNYNEGWNAYKQAMVERGVKLYGERPNLLVGATSYPPVSFHLISWLGNENNFVVVGRWISLGSLLIAGLFVGLIVQEYGAGGIASAFCSLVYIVGIGVLFPSRLGMNDPQLLGEALSIAGVYFYVRNPESHQALLASAVAFCLAGFTKQNLIAFPAAVAVDLLFRSRKALTTWIICMLTAGGLLTALTLALDGRYFFEHLLFPRVYSLHNGWHNNTHLYLMTFQGLLVMAGVWMFCGRRFRVLLISLFVVTHTVAFLLSGGDGVDVNIYFNALAATVIVCGAALADTERMRETVPASNAYSGLSTALMAALFATILIHAPGALHESHQGARLVQARDAEFQSAAAMLKSRPGPAFCESLLLCYEAGKSYQFDPLVVSDQIKLGRLDENAILQMLRKHEIQTVQFTVSPEQASGSAEAMVQERLHYTRGFMKEVISNYQIAARNSQMLVFEPR